MVVYLCLNSFGSLKISCLEMADVVRYLVISFFDIGFYLYITVFYFNIFHYQCAVKLGIVFQIFYYFCFRIMADENIPFNLSVPQRVGLLRITLRVLVSVRTVTDLLVKLTSKSKIHGETFKV